MRGPICFLTLVLLFPALQCGLSSPSWVGAGVAPLDEGGVSESLEVVGKIDTTLMIIELFPAYGCEFVTIGNVGDTVVGVRDWSLTDGEGILYFQEALFLDPGSTITLCTDTGALMRIASFDMAIEFDELRLSGRFALADKGDEAILLEPGGSVVDAVIYGDSSYVGEGWMGQAVDRVPRGKMIKRIGGTDTNSSIDWQVSSPGRSDLAAESFEVTVEPFSFPDGAQERILRELRYASATISIALYQLQHPMLIRGIGECALRGVEVRILLEGQPVGGIDDSLMVEYESLSAAGCNITLLRSVDGYKRYDYMHGKYAVIDGYRSVITSENWVSSAFQSNRGWGAVVVSESFANYLLALFDQDRNPDRIDLSWVEPSDHPPSGDYYNITYKSNLTRIERYRGTAFPIISPDFSHRFIADLIGRAKERVLVQMMFCQNIWLEEESLLTELRSAARRGVSVRVLLDSTWFNLEGSRNNTLVVQTLNDWAIEDGTDLKAGLVTPYHEFELLHNKGLIIDEVTVISSINWCDASFYSNREVGFAFISSEMAGMFAQLYLRDWLTDPALPQISVAVLPSRPSDDDTIILDARNSSDNVGISKYIWDLNDDGTIDWTGAVYPVQLPAGHYTVRATVIDECGNSASMLVELVVREAEARDRGLGPLVPILFLTLLSIAWTLRKRIKRG